MIGFRVWCLLQLNSSELRYSDRQPIAANNGLAKFSSAYRWLPFFPTGRDPPDRKHIAPIRLPQERWQQI